LWWKRVAGSTWRWLYPGLRIKRWLLLAAIGFGVLLLGFALLLGPKLAFAFGRLMRPLLQALPGSVYSGLLMILGLVLLILGLHQAVVSIREALLHNRLTGNNKPLIELIFTRRYLENGPRVVTIGGGTGLSVLLRDLKLYTSNLTAVVTVTDDGGSSGRLRGELGILPPGDIRSCLLALADTEPVMEKLFDHRFTAGSGLAGHSFGNLLIVAMAEMFGFQEAVRLFGRVLAIRGRVYPVTLDLVQLEAVDVQGNLTRGQSILYHQEGPLKRISLVPDRVKPLPEVLEAIDRANVIVLGPGSLFTSIIPNLLVPGIVEAIVKARAPVFYICNVATQQGETTGFSAADHVQALLEHSSPDLLDYIVVNSDLTISKEGLAFLKHHGSALVQPSYQDLRKMNSRVISAPLLDHKQVTRHDGRRLARLIMDHALPPRRRSWTGRWEERLQHRRAGRQAEARQKAPISASGGGG
jgi:uncharacterized cofD-like protein